MINRSDEKIAVVPLRVSGGTKMQDDPEAGFQDLIDLREHEYHAGSSNRVLNSHAELEPVIINRSDEEIAVVPLDVSGGASTQDDAREARLQDLIDLGEHDYGTGISGKVLESHADLERQEFFDFAADRAFSFSALGVLGRSTASVSQQALTFGEGDPAQTDKQVTLERVTERIGHPVEAPHKRGKPRVSVTGRDGVPVARSLKSNDVSIMGRLKIQNTLAQRAKLNGQVSTDQSEASDSADLHLRSVLSQRIANILEQVGGSRIQVFLMREAGMLNVRVRVHNLKQEKISELSDRINTLLRDAGFQAGNVNFESSLTADDYNNKRTGDHGRT